MKPLRTPSDITLKKYGITMDEWMAYFIKQGEACAICGRYPASGRLCVDHEHAKLWRKMPPEQRKIYVRGLCCWTCNHYFLARGMTPEIAGNVKGYLETYLRRRDAALNAPPGGPLPRVIQGTLTNRMPVRMNVAVPGGVTV